MDCEKKFQLSDLLNIRHEVKGHSLFLAGTLWVNKFVEMKYKNLVSQNYSKLYLYMYLFRIESLLLIIPNLPLKIFKAN